MFNYLLIILCCFSFHLTRVYSINYEKPNYEKWLKGIRLLKNDQFERGTSELVFLLDRSGSIGLANFEAEKGFVESLLQHFVIAPNATRVAVIAYSQNVVRYIDYIKEPKNRCLFAEELQKIKYEDSAATNIAGALDEAYEVLKNSRPGVRKVTILLSDGFSTYGNHPLPSAKKLTESGTEVFAVGIGRFLGNELKSLCTSEQHFFHCYDFQNFRLLAEVIRGDPHETEWSLEEGPRNCDHFCNSVYRGQPEDPGCCDYVAKCSCALKLGLYECICGPGFYGLSGLLGDCKACPKGTYKDKLEPTDRCTKCPDNSTTVNVASTSIEDCICKKGYEGNPLKGISCQLKRCPPLQAPQNGRISKCDNVYKSTCKFTCHENYELQRKDSEKRVCRDSKEWSGSEAVCQKIKCVEPMPPKYGDKICSSTDFLVGTTCEFSCDPGYILLGEKKKTCRSTKEWLPEGVECNAITCPALHPKNHIIIRNCDFGKHYEYNKLCSFQCPKGFEMKGPHHMLCDIDSGNKQNGMWKGFNGEIQQPWCKDIEPPSISCPPDISIPADPGKNYSILSLSKPRVSDNSGIEPKVKVTPFIKDSFKFFIGEYKIKFTAIDQTLLKSSCETTVKVNDVESPKVIYCPRKIEVNTSDFEVSVSWQEPVFSDNSNRPLDVKKTEAPGHKFTPGRHTVTYIAEDLSGNFVKCSFDVIVSKNECPYYPPPVNGAIACHYWINGQICEVHCNDLFEFSSPPADWYICDASNEWITYPQENYSIPWPDCGEWYVPSRLRTMIKTHYFTGNCHDLRVQRSIQEAYMKHFESEFNKSALCIKDGACRVNSVKVTCGKTNYSVPIRAKRDIWTMPRNDVIEIDIEITVSSETKDNSQDNMKELINTVNEIVDNMNQNVTDDKIVLPLNDQGDSNIVLDPVSVEISESEFLCYNGAVLKNEECVNCPVGTFHDLDKNICEKCLTGFYQDVEGSTICISCPNGTWTETAGSKNVTDCKEICLPGSYSETGLETCEACPVGSFQPSSFQTSCISCPPLTTTWIEGTISSDECREKCMPGSYSETGLEPCIPCDLGYYQDEHGQTFCIMCPENLTTTDIKSDSESDCLDYDHCHNNPCMNGADCINGKFNYNCICPEGFTGIFCEKNIDDCEHLPCAEGSTCIDLVANFQCLCPPGFNGSTCREEINECESNPCENFAICVDQIAGFECLCLPGYEGRFCEIDIDICEKYPCANEAYCEEINNDRLCHCLPGFEGADCSINIDDCLFVTCTNGGSCLDGVMNYTCMCLPGYIGRHCEINHDDCIGHRCAMGSTCIDHVNGYECLCLPGYSGIFCEQQLPSDFMMSFNNPSVSNFAFANRIPQMSSATISMWVQTTDKYRQGAMISYAARDRLRHSVANALTLTDYGSLKIYINDEPVYTNIKLNDGNWNHVIFTWSSNDGSWNLYKNGNLVASGENLQTNQQIPGGGSLIIGQEQDCVGGEFSPTETFVGNITRVNLWNKVLSSDDIKNLCNLKDVSGSVSAWPDFQKGVNGQIKIYTSYHPWN
ncbi:sushi, von Willebrand factor type A, EGF and pentraxin domain-containing protein 1-like [Centruroides vittatus]|uniref:sushi, von Willebrand factor type A, EGF and pentraxin domain-containing protein 1-like n=1 Tax=Centruroides vittatus TaxID=120091 RepID=UPI00350EB16D